MEKHMSKTTKESQSTTDTTTLSFSTKHAKKEGDQFTVELTSTVDFLTEFMNDETLKKFLAEPGTNKFIANIIGVKGLLEKFPKEEVLKSVTWDYVRDFFYDHMDVSEILNHIGYEKVSEHFKDKIQSQRGSKKSINTPQKKSVLETLNESEGPA